ncbi:hypothetical protein [Azospirillum brasilense]|nr:hypothetical protein [Azospirillum brasilense]UKJ76548.1 hypothetical protein H1Q64_22640 [Azospirillum brasilense]
MLTFDDCLALADLAPERRTLVNDMGTVPALHLMSDAADPEAVAERDEA